MTIGQTSEKRVKMQARGKTAIAEPRWWSILKRQAAEFCRETGLHGYKYISQTQRSKPERIVWAIAVFVSLCSALTLMKMTWNFYATHPTLTVIESTHHGIWHYPFPAITVCNLNRMSYNLTKEFVKKLKTPPSISKEFLVEEMRLLNELLVPGIFGYDVQRNLTRLQNIINDNNLSILDVMNSIMKNCSNLLIACKWKGRLGPCDKFFSRSLSRDGLCCSFNYYTFPDVKKQEDIENIAACGLNSGMTMLINPEPDDYHASFIGAYGMKIMIHDAFDYPDHNAEMQLVRMDSQHFLSMNPWKMYSKPEVRKLAVSTRKCIYADEAGKVLYGTFKKRNLTSSKYSYRNCLAECQATVVRAKCGCIPYYFPQNNSRVCDLTDIQCLKRYKSFFDTSWPATDEQKSVPNTVASIRNRPCGCVPDCSLFHYPIESSFGTLDPSVYYFNGSFTRNPRNAVSIRNHSIVHVFFSDLVAFEYRRSVNYSWRNLFASFGGLLGLFAGFSLMSIFEFLYFFVIRIITDSCVNLRKRKNIQQKQSN